MLYKNKSAKNRELEFLKRKLKNIENENYFLRMRMQSFENSLTWRINRKIDKFLNLFLPNGSKIKEAYINAIMASNILFSQCISGLFRAINFCYRGRFRYRWQKTSKLDKEKIKTEIESFSNKPKISIIMPVYNVNPKWLNLAVKSVTSQLYKNWELCIVDDGSDNEDTIRFLKSINNDRVRVKFLKENHGIAGASNEALGLATGDYVALLDNDDELSQDALYEVVKTINNYDPDLIYSDEDKIDMKGRPVEPFFKPDFSLDMFFSCNYLCHLSVFRKSILDSIRGFRKGFEGSQDYDLLLRYTEKAKNIYHIPKILYHWRKIPGSCAMDYNAKPYAYISGKRALEDSLKRRGISGNILFGNTPGTYKVKFSFI